MVLNRGAIVEQNEEKVIFDYTGALYPNGLDPEQVYYFNDEDIDEIVFEGFKDEEEERFQTLYKEWHANNSELKKR